MKLRKPTKSYEARRAALEKGVGFAKPKVEETVTTVPEIKTENSQIPIPVKKPQAPKTKTKPKPTKELKPVAAVFKTPINDSIKIQITSCVPQSGYSSTFDYLVKTSNPKKALQQTMNKAFKILEEGFRNGEIDLTQTSYPMEEIEVSSTKVISSELWTKAKDKFDPVDVLPEREIGRILTIIAITELQSKEK